MWDVDAIIASYQLEQLEEKKTPAREKAIDVLWRTGMISLEEYFYVKFMYSREHQREPDGHSFISSLQLRNENWKTPRSSLVWDYIDASKCFPYSTYTIVPRG
jgi:hypothetical protein